jgi:hypothetical protein
VQWVEVLRGGPNSRGRIHPMVEPLRSLRQCRGLDMDKRGPPGVWEMCTKVCAVCVLFSPRCMRNMR